jgi:hypothetical protein
MPKTDEQKQREREAERQRQARRSAAKKRLDALPPMSRDAVTRRAQSLEANHEGPKVTAVAFLEQALDEFEKPDRVRATGSGSLKIVEGSESGDEPPKATPAKPRRPKSPREKSQPKEAGRPEPETKDPEQLASNAKRARGGDAAITATVAVSVPEGTAYCPSCDTTKAEAEFWPANRTAKSKRRKTCRECFNEAWRVWDAQRRAKKAAEAAAV